jgi:hypothetical protein
MRSVLKLGLVVLSLLTPVVGPAARAAAADDYSDTILLSPDQGEALAAFAAQSEKRIRPKPDCSHLVHLLYTRAGLIYPYEDSRVLYRGVGDFQRVKTPQAGDLVVWLGHVGIVLSPEEKTFLSSVRSGIITESWTAAHWVHRGRPRFYRYRIGPSADMNLLARVMSDDRNRQIDARNAGLSATSVPLPSSTAQSPTESEMNGAQPEGSELSPQNAGNADERSGDTGSIIATIGQRQMPSRRQIAAAIIENSKARARQLIGGETLDVTRPFSIFNQLEVKRVKIKHENGSVTLEVSETICQEDGRILPAKRMEREFSISHRSDGIWVISDPRERTYLAEEQALEIFERQAEMFLRRAPNSSNTRIVVKALDRLYDQRSDTPQRAAIR